MRDGRWKGQRRCPSLQQIARPRAAGHAELGQGWHRGTQPGATRAARATVCIWVGKCKAPQERKKKKTRTEEKFLARALPSASPQEYPPKVPSSARHCGALYNAQHQRIPARRCRSPPPFAPLPPVATCRCHAKNNKLKKKPKKKKPTQIPNHVAALQGEQRAMNTLRPPGSSRYGGAAHLCASRARRPQPRSP